MSKKYKEYQTPISEYDREDAQNRQKVEELLRRALPELDVLFDRFDLSLESLLDLAYSISLVKRHGWGNVEIVVQDGEISTINAVVRKKLGEIQNITLPKRKNVV